MKTVKRALCALAMAVLAAGAATGHARTPLHEAAARGDTEFVKAWIAKKRNLDATYSESGGGLEGNYARTQRVTALMTAAQFAQFEVVKLLVDAGADLYAESRWRDGSNPRTAFDYAVILPYSQAEYAAASRRRAPIAEYLWTRSDRVRFASRLGEHIAQSCRALCDDKIGGDARSNLALYLIGITRDEAVLGKGIGDAACTAQQPLKVLEFLDRHQVRFPKNTLHCIAYHPTARHVHSTQVRIAAATFLLDRGADPNDLPHTPLRGAASTHDLEMVKLLLARGAKPDLPNSDGMTAIAAAANSCVHGADTAQVEPRQKPQLAVIEHLLQAGAEPKLAASGSARSQLRLLADCCNRKPHTATQRRICEVFGL